MCGFGVCGRGARSRLFPVRMAPWGRLQRNLQYYSTCAENAPKWPEGWRPIFASRTKHGKPISAESRISEIWFILQVPLQSAAGFSFSPPPGNGPMAAAGGLKSAAGSSLPHLQGGSHRPTRARCSRDGLHDSAFGAHGRSVDGRRQRTAHEGDDRGDLFGSGEALQQGTRAALGEKLTLDRRGIDAVS